MKDEKDFLRSAFGMHKIKYSILDSLGIYNDIDSVHINYSSIFNFYLKHYGKLTNFTPSDIYLIVSQIFNLAAHYKHYFVKRQQNVKIYIYVSKSDREIFESVIDFSLIISQYITNIYFIECDIPIPVAIEYISKAKCRNSIILTKNKLDVLLVSKYRSVLKSNKDKSILYNKDNVYDNMTKRKYNWQISYKLLPVVYSFCGIGGNKIDGFGPYNILKTLNAYVERNIIVNNKYIDIEDFIHDIKDITVFDDKALNTVVDNFDKIDINKKYSKYINSAKKKQLDDFIVDKFSNKDIKSLNIKYFTGLDSLMLEELFEEYNPKNKITW